MLESAELNKLSFLRLKLKGLSFLGADHINVNGRSVAEFKISFLPIGIVREVRAKEYRNLGNLNLGAEANLKLKVLTKTAAPGMERILSVSLIIGNTVNSVTLEEAGIFSRYEISDRMRIILMYVVAVMGVKGYLALTIDLCLGRLGASYSVAVTAECFGSIAGCALVIKGNYKLKGLVGKVDYRLGKSFVKRHSYVLCIVGIDAPFVAGLVFAVIALVDLLSVCLELTFAHFVKKL